MRCYYDPMMRPHVAGGPSAEISELRYVNVLKVMVMVMVMVMVRVRVRNCSTSVNSVSDVSHPKNQ